MSPAVPSHPSTSAAAPSPEQPPRRSAFALRRAPGGLAAWLDGPKLALLIIVPLAIALLARSRRETSAGGALKKQRREAAQRALRELEARGNDAGEVSRVVRELIGSRVHHHGAALSSDEALAALATSGIDAQLVARARAVLGACDAALYGNAGDTSDLRDDAVSLIRGFVEAA